MPPPAPPLRSSARLRSLLSSADDTDFLLTNLDALKRPQLQKLCSSLNISSSGSCAVLIARLQKARSSSSTTTTTETKTKTKTSTPKSSKSSATKTKRTGKAIANSKATPPAKGKPKRITTPQNYSDSDDSSAVTPTQNSVLSKPTSATASRDATPPPPPPPQPPQSLSSTSMTPGQRASHLLNSPAVPMSLLGKRRVSSSNSPSSDTYNNNSNSNSNSTTTSSPRRFLKRPQAKIFAASGLSERNPSDISSEKLFDDSSAHANLPTSMGPSTALLSTISSPSHLIAAPSERLPPVFSSPEATRAASRTPETISLAKQATASILSATAANSISTMSPARPPVPSSNFSSPASNRVPAPTAVISRNASPAVAAVINSGTFSRPSSSSPLGGAGGAFSRTASPARIPIPAPPVAASPQHGLMGSIAPPNTASPSPQVIYNRTASPSPARLAAAIVAASAATNGASVTSDSRLPRFDRSDALAAAFAAAHSPVFRRSLSPALAAVAPAARPALSRSSSPYENRVPPPHHHAAAAGLARHSPAPQQRSRTSSPAQRPV